MKEMDTILDEMAAKWDTLNKDQQIALAQTVAGVRQYTQLIALMDNWDFMEENLATSANSTGALDEQQKIYEESWAASQDRVKASMEGVFDSLINEDFFIELNDTLSSVLGVVEKLVDAIGGMPGILSIVGVLITSIFKDELSNGINNALHNFKNFTGASKEELKRLKKEAYEYARSMTEGLADTPGSEAMDAQRRHLERTYEMQKQLEVAIVGTNSAQEKAAREAFKTAENYSKAAVEAAKYAEEVNANFALEGAYAHCMYSPQMLYKLSNEINSKNQYFIVDVYNYLAYDNYKEQINIFDQCIELFNDRIIIFHIKDFIVDEENKKLAQCCIGKGLMNYDYMIPIIKEKCPNAVLVFEGSKPEDMEFSYNFIKEKLGE